MWGIFKIDKKKINLLRKDIKKKLGKDVLFYNPKILIEKYKNNKLFSKEYNLLGDYIFCYHSKLSSENTFDLIKFSRGLKCFLPGSIISQNEIKEFINRCKKSEDNKGNLTNNFFKYNINENYKFKSGPMTEKLFKAPSFIKV